MQAADRGVGDQDDMYYFNTSKAMHEKHAESGGLEKEPWMMSGAGSMVVLGRCDFEGATSELYHL